VEKVFKISKDFVGLYWFYEIWKDLFEKTFYTQDLYKKILFYWIYNTDL